MLASKLLSAAGGTETLYVDDVFSTYLYTGNGSTQTINNGIDLAGKGGLVWFKPRNQAFNHALYDTARGTSGGFGLGLISNSTSAQVTGSGNYLTTFNSDGFTTSANGSTSGDSWVSWTFRKAAKFFDCGTYTGNGVAGRQIPHSLGVAPGMVIVKSTSDAGSAWAVYHRSTAATHFLWLHDTSAATSSSGYWNNTAPDASAFTVGSNGNVNNSGATYVWYAFAHDTSAEGIIQCGSFTTDGSGNATVNLGWEPQFLVTKRTDAVLHGEWRMFDSMRGFPASGNASRLMANASDAEGLIGSTWPTSTGFTYTSSGASQTFIYVAIRRPNKPPTTGPQVYNAIARTGTGAAATVTGVGFAPDLAIIKNRSNPFSLGPHWQSRLIGRSWLQSSGTGAETTPTASNDFLSFEQDGYAFGSQNSEDANNSSYTYINHFLKRAPGVFDVVCWTRSTTVATLNHSLGVVPDLIIKKPRSRAGTFWHVMVNVAPYDYRYEFYLNDTQAISGPSGSLYWNAAPTATTFDVNMSSDGSSSGDTFVAYLFATKAGISKVGSYTGNGSSQTINAGFTTGARFILIKRTDSTGDWYVWDSVRGIVAGNDPHLSLNSTAAEVTTNDSIDPDNTGFIVNQLAATNINVTSATYVYLALA